MRPNWVKHDSIRKILSCMTIGLIDWTIVLLEIRGARFCRKESDQLGMGIHLRGQDDVVELSTSDIS